MWRSGTSPFVDALARATRQLCRLLISSRWAEGASLLAFGHSRRGIHVLAIDRERALRAAEKYAARSRHKQAIAEYRRVLAESPGDARILLKVGDLQARMGAHVQAVDTYARVGRIYADDGFAAKAVAVYKQVQQLIDEEVPQLGDYFLYVYPTLASLYQELRLPTEAVGMYDAYAMMLARCGRLREAATVLGIVVERGGDNPLTRLRLAELLIEEGEDEDALDQFLAAADGLLRLGRVDEAIRVLDHGFARFPQPDLMRLGARALLDRARGDDGMQALIRLQQAFHAEPKNLETLALLARAFETIDQGERAFEVRKETVRIAKEQGALDAAQTVLEALLREAPEDPAVQALVKTLAPPPPAEPPELEPEPSIEEVSAELIAPEPSLSVEGHAVSVDTDMPVIEKGAAGDQPVVSLEAVDELVSTALQHHANGRPTEAMACLREALELAPGYPSAVRAMGQVAPAPPMPAVPAVPLISDAPVVDSALEAPPPIPTDLLREHPTSEQGHREVLRGFRGDGARAEALDEAEFFASRGLFEDAIAILEELRSRFPDDPEIASRADEISRQAKTACADPQPSVLGVAEPTIQASRLSQGADPAFLQDALADLQSPQSTEGAAVDLAGGTLDVDQLFDAFKQGITAQVDEQDSRMHYDLGLAYLEMGKHDAAVDAFRTAAQDPARQCVSLSMIASVFRSRGQLDAAMDALRQASEVDRKTREEEVGVHYELASLFEERREWVRAVAHYDKVVRLAPDFRDARARLRQLRGQAAPTDEAITGDDEFDRAFEGLISTPDDERS